MSKPKNLVFCFYEINSWDFLTTFQVDTHIHTSKCKNKCTQSTNSSVYILKLCVDSKAFTLASLSTPSVDCAPAVALELLLVLVTVTSKNSSIFGHSEGKFIDKGLLLSLKLCRKLFVCLHHNSQSS